MPDEVTPDTTNTQSPQSQPGLGGAVVITATAEVIPGDPDQDIEEGEQ